MIRRQQLHEQVRSVALDRVGLSDIDPDTPTGSLGIGHQQLIEIATALDRDCRVLILDEPTSALSAGEAENLFGWLDRLRDQGIGIIYISHRLDEVARLPIASPCCAMAGMSALAKPPSGIDRVKWSA